MTKDKLFYILLFSSIGYTLLLLPASFLALTSPFLMKGEISGTISEWVNYISIISFPAIVLTGIFTAWSSYHNDNIRWSLICISLPVINLLLYAITNVF
jgi:hypothetical protein